eukprot:575044-Heterocapsa_arctica.AAC.1
MAITRTSGFEFRNSNCPMTAYIFQGLRPKRQLSCEADWVYAKMKDGACPNRTTSAGKARSHSVA